MLPSRLLAHKHYLHFHPLEGQNSAHLILKRTFRTELPHIHLQETMHSDLIAEV